ncbi:hypothetical protein SMMN14_05224 [Sphaerulina musiva]
MTQVYDKSCATSFFWPPSRYDRAPASSTTSGDSPVDSQLRRPKPALRHTEFRTKPSLSAYARAGPRNTIDEQNWPAVLSQVSVYCTKTLTNAAMETLMNVGATKKSE